MDDGNDDNSNSTVPSIFMMPTVKILLAALRSFLSIINIKNASAIIIQQMKNSSNKYYIIHDRKV
jgi:hypothetical protein